MSQIEKISLVTITQKASFHFIKYNQQYIFIVCIYNIYILLLIAAMIIINCLFGTLYKSFESF